MTWPLTRVLNKLQAHREVISRELKDQVSQLRNTLTQDVQHLPALMRTVEQLRDSCRREHCLSCQVTPAVFLCYTSKQVATLAAECL